MLFRSIEAGNEAAAFNDGIIIAGSLVSALKNCKEGSKEEIKALGNWFYKKLGNKQLAVDAVSANAHIHSEEIEHHVQLVWDVLGYPPTLKMPAKAGWTIARTAYWSLGPVSDEWM